MGDSDTERNSEMRDALRRAGLRLTAPRLATLDALGRLPHATAEDVTRVVTSTLGTVSRQGIYDVLSALEAAGLLRRIEPAGHPSRYETRVEDNHHHVICRACGTIADVDCAVGAMPCLKPSSSSGFMVDEAEINFWGWCPACQLEREKEERT
jgi:Fur family ferric uptake transcriptional regulator